MKIICVWAFFFCSISCSFSFPKPGNQNIGSISGTGHTIVGTQHLITYENDGHVYLDTVGDAGSYNNGRKKRQTVTVNAASDDLPEQQLNRARRDTIIGELSASDTKIIGSEISETFSRYKVINSDQYEETRNFTTADNSTADGNSTSLEIEGETDSKENNEEQKTETSAAGKSNEKKSSSGKKKSSRNGKKRSSKRNSRRRNNSKNETHGEKMSSQRFVVEGNVIDAGVFNFNDS